ncbi:acyltransferase family protein [Pseudodesulfovibrio sp.]|uniref:acyltransferase family protein n=1 Tax=Pseudodesulfovibrio sp. TaxID=2035812 RepID=UPI00260B6E8C|nr:acyltransferase family protein [Pseudodesulfovibrio sp.]MDD3310587.1 acyltransferase family protein [Pseudodesulfovibrio sp.]
MGFIRLLLALAVFNSHFPLMEDVHIVDGHEAVLTFFAISGFYMALILDTAYGSPRRFYAARLLSLYPQYLFALVLSLTLLLALDVHPYTSSAEFRRFLADPGALALSLWSWLTMTCQDLFFCLGRTADGALHYVPATRDGVWRQLPLVQTWSLSLEVVFYAMAPFLVRMRTRTLVLIAAASLAVKLAVLFGPLRAQGFTIRFFPAECWLFCGGILAYRVHARLPREASALDWLLLAGLAGLVFVADAAPDEAEPFFLPGCALAAMPFVFRALRHLPLDRLAGKISYPFYLLHFTAIAAFEKFLEEPVGWHILVATLAGAIATHFLFTQGLNTMRRNLRLRPVLPVPAAPVPVPLKVRGGRS